MTNLILWLVYGIMPKNKKSKIGNIEKLRKILDGPYDVKTSPSEGNENLESIRQRLTGESNKFTGFKGTVDIFYSNFQKQRKEWIAL